MGDKEGEFFKIFLIAEIPVSEQLLTDPKRQLIAKVWHKDSNVSEYVIGFAAIDLGILLHNGFNEISGWYNIMDFVGRCRGQIKVDIKPKNDVNIGNLRQKISKQIKGFAILFRVRYFWRGYIVRFWPRIQVSGSPKFGFW